MRSPQSVALLAIAMAFGASITVAADQQKQARESRRARSATVAQTVTILGNPSPRIIRRARATFITPHFSKVVLGDGDSLTVRGKDASTTPVTYTKATLPASAASGFWSIIVRGDTALFELVNASGGAAYELDVYSAGLENVKRTGGSLQQICGEDDTEEAPCYAGNREHMRSRAVARLLINGIRSCTGWLIGSEGHFLTNEHCVSSDGDAASVKIEFMAEGAACATNCNTPFACGGVVEAQSAQLLAKDATLDFALLKVDRTLAQKYGFLTVRPPDPDPDKPSARQGEQIYIPQHPRGVGKRLAFKSTDPWESTIEDREVAHVITLDEQACEGGPLPEIGYAADTDEGSSGSPVIAVSDHRVIALHHCGGCLNRAVPMQRILARIGSYLPPSAFGEPQ